MRASSRSTSLKSVFNYILLMKGQVKCQQKLSRKKKIKFLRRSLREEDYYERILTKSIKDCVDESKFLVKARKGNRLYAKLPPNMICCGGLLKATELFGNARCLDCKGWYIGKKRFIRKDMEEYGFKDIILLCETNSEKLPSTRELNSKGLSWVNWLIEEEGGRQLVEEKIKYYFDN